MGEVSKNEKSRVQTFMDGLKSEFRKIIWPNKEDLVKQTGVVIVVSVILGAVIAIVDVIMQYGIDFLIK